MLLDHDDLFRKIQAATNFHHSYNGGLLEHVWSMTRICGFLADHYAKYYDSLNPPLNKGVIVAAAILHDLGKIRELKYHPVEAKYTKEGSLIGHVLMGRDLVREAARKIEGFPEETLLLLEHAILAHHGKKEFGAPILPQTLEALIVSFVDDLDAKINIVARELRRIDDRGRVHRQDLRHGPPPDLQGHPRRMPQGIDDPPDASGPWRTGPRPPTMAPDSRRPLVDRRDSRSTPEIRSHPAMNRKHWWLALGLDWRCSAAPRRPTSPRPTPPSRQPHADPLPDQAG